MVGFVLAVLGGTATGVGGYIGAKIANSVMNIGTDISNYIYFDKENGWDEDHPEETNKSIPGRLVTVFTDGFKKEKKKEVEK